MRVMILVKATPESEAGEKPHPELLEEMARFNKDLVDAGIMLAGEGLQPSSQGKCVVFYGEGRDVLPGPFIPTHALVAGFWLWQVRDMDEAIEWVRRCPNPMPGICEVEIRPVMEAEDFDDALTPEAAEAERELRERVEQE